MSVASRLGIRRIPVLLLLVLCPALSSPVSSQEVASFPGEHWEAVSSLEAAGWSPEHLEEAWQIADDIGSGVVFVIQHGRIVAEWGDVTKKYKIYSARKQLLSSLLGRARAEGRLSLDASLAELGIDDRGGLNELEKSATVEDLLTSRSGVYHDAAYEARAHKRARPARGSHVPGTFFHYNNWDFNVLGTIYEQATGQSLFEDFERLIARPIGMEDFDVTTDTRYKRSRSSDHPAYLFEMTARDLARYGVLWLKRGRWADQQLVPNQWVGASTTSYVHPALNELQGFGYLWWVYPSTPGLFGASGKGNQKIVIWPERDLVVVHLASTKWLGLFGSEVTDTDFWRLFFAIAAAEDRGPGSGD